MRGLLSEGALVCVEVQKLGQDGILRLAARTAKFGKVSQLKKLETRTKSVLSDVFKCKKEMLLCS